MFHNLSKFHSDKALTKALSKAARNGRDMTASELFEQQVSFVYGSMSSNSNLTKDDVRRHLRVHQGAAAEAV